MPGGASPVHADVSSVGGRDDNAIKPTYESLASGDGVREPSALRDQQLNLGVVQETAAPYPDWRRNQKRRDEAIFPAL